MNGFDKFGWLKALQSDHRLSDTAFRIGVVIATTFTRADGTGWVFELARLLDVGGRSMDRHTRDIAIRLLVKRDHVSQTYRSSGGRGITARGSFDLLKPGSSNVQVSDIPGSSNGQVSAENLAGWSTKPGGLHTETWRVGLQNLAGYSPVESPLPAETSPTGTSSGTSSGNSSGGASPESGTSPGEPIPSPTNPTPLETFAKQTHDDPAPPRHCPLHMPDGTDDNCGRCADTRREREAWDRAEPDRIAAQNAEKAEARQAAINNCQHCDADGWVDVDDNTVRHCDHLAAATT